MTTAIAITAKMVIEYQEVSVTVILGSMFTLSIIRDLHTHPSYNLLVLLSTQCKQQAPTLHPYPDVIPTQQSFVTISG